MTLKSFLIIVLAGVAYVATTWFYFGSTHPCEILVARQKDYQIDVAERHHREEIDSWQEMARKVLPANDYARFVRNIKEYSSALGRQENMKRSVVKELRESVREITPAQCAWQAMTWQPPHLTPGGVVN